MSGFVPKALSKLTRYPVIALPYSRREEAIPRELIIDYDTGGIFMKNDAGEIIDVTYSVNVSAVYIKTDNGDIISLETVLNRLIIKSLNVKEVSEMSIFRIPNEAQFDLKSVIQKNNLVQVYNFDEAQDNSIPMKIDDRISWIYKDTFLESIGMSISAEGCFDVLDLIIQTDHPFKSVSVSNAKDENDDPIENANGAYIQTAGNNYVWTRTVESDVFTATYILASNTWIISHPTITIASASVQTTTEDYNKVHLIENKKQQTVVPSGLELNVFIPERTGELTYSKIIWKVTTGDVAPIFNFKTTSNGHVIAANNIVWEFAESDPIVKENCNTFFIIETWNNGESWFGKTTVMGKSLHEMDEQYFLSVLENYYTKTEVDEFTTWTIAP